MSNTSVWSSECSVYLDPITSAGPFGAGKYESLPNFVGGLYVEDGLLKLMKKDNSVEVLGKASDLQSNKNLFLSVLDEIFE